jgi:nucleoside-diphosphate-sugar epimerase
MTNQPTYLVTGSMGFIGAWVLYHLVKQGKTVVSYDLSTRRDRLNLLLTPAEQEAIRFVTGDLTQSDHVMQTVSEQHITHIIHLGALQVPFVRANPILGAQVNVVGTTILFEAAKKHGIPHLVYASSIAVYGAPDRYPAGLLAPDATLDPHTLYGVFKQANELTARVYWEENQITSAALRPYVVYGVGRDQGMTSEPTKAMLAVAAGKAHHIAFGGVSQYQLGSDTALQFITAAEHAQPGAFVFNLGGAPTHMSDVVDMIRSLRPNAQVTFEDRPLPFPIGFDDAPLRGHYPTVYETPLIDGIRQTIEHFERCLADGRMQPPA